MRPLSSSVSDECAGSTASISVWASLSVMGSSEIADHKSLPARRSNA